MQLSPVPNIPPPFIKRGKQGAKVLNTEAKICLKKTDKGKRTKGIMIKKSQKKSTRITEKKKEEKNRTKINIDKENVELKPKTSFHKRKACQSSTVKQCRSLPKRRKPLKIYSSSEDEEFGGHLICYLLG